MSDRTDGAGLRRVALVVLSDKASSGERPDACLPAMRESLPPGWHVVSEEIIADDRRELESLLKVVSDRGAADCIFTSGGTGLGPRVRETKLVIRPALAHAIDVLRGEAGEHGGVA